MSHLPIISLPCWDSLSQWTAALFSLLIYPVTHSYLDTPFRTKWYAIAWFFFFRFESGIHVLHRTDWLSPYKHEQPITEIPIILSLYRILLTYSQHCFIATNSLQNLLHYTSFVAFRTSRWALGSSILKNLSWSAWSPYLLQSMHQHIWSCRNLSSWRRSICWDNLLYLTIVFLPIIPREIIIVNGGVCWIKYHPSPVFPLEVCKDVKYLVLMTFTRQFKVRRHQRNFQTNVYST